jgi:hypothetical protein
VSALGERLRTLLDLPVADRDLLRVTVRHVAAERWSWAGVAEKLLDLSL